MNPSPLVLPNDLIREVLSFLPVKSLVRFKCVSKYWKTLISDNEFVKLHLKRSKTQNLLFSFVKSHLIPISGGSSNGSGDEFAPDCSIVPYPIRRLLDNPSFTLFDGLNYHLNYKGCDRTVGSCNGLVLLAGDSFNFHPNKEYWNRDHWLCVWNPATRKTSKKFGHFRENGGSSTQRFSFAFGCDNSKDTYKVVAYRYNRGQSTSEVRVLSLGDDVWRNVESFPAVPYRFNYVYLSGTLNWLAIQSNDMRVQKLVIVSFDLRTETYNQYLLPRCFDRALPRESVFGVLGDCLCFSYCYKETGIVIWKMNEFGVEDSWTQFLNISFQNLQIFSKYNFQLVPLLLSDDTLVLTSSHESQAILYNLRDNTVKRTNIIAGRAITNNGTKNNLGWEYAKDYVESLVPIF